MHIIIPITYSILFTLSALHVYWALGGTRGVNYAVPTMNGKPIFEPGRLITLVVAVGLSFMGVLVILLHYQGTSQYSWVLRPIGVVLGIVFGLRSIGDFNLIGLFKRVKDSTFAKYDTLAYTPLCVFLSAVFFVLSIA
ncbi:MAG: DUF3995 domain-containing protein [Nitrospira sp.]|nr:DUF3995 domain-containing protein [Nitrospira sp.]